MGYEARASSAYVQRLPSRPFAPVHAETVPLTADGNFHIRLFGNFEDAHGAQRDLDLIRRVEWCVGATVPANPEQLKKAACVEGRQIAVAFDYNTPLSNKIFTNWVFRSIVTGHSGLS